MDQRLLATFVLLLLYSVTVGAEDIVPAVPTPSWANNVAELLGTFYDPFSHTPLVPDFEYAGRDSSGKLRIRCPTPQCKSCAKKVLLKLKTSNTDEDLHKEIDELLNSEGIMESPGTLSCDNLLDEAKVYTCSVEPARESQIRQFVKSLDYSPPKICQTNNTDEHLSRRKRFGNIYHSKPPADSVRSEMSCKGRGTDIEGHEDYIRLCHICYAIRYYGMHMAPALMEEIYCSSTDPSCLQGHCVCVQNEIQVGFNNTRTGNFEYFPVAAACEPFMHPDSSFRALFNLTHIQEP